MKKLLVILFASAVLYSCGSNEGGDAGGGEANADSSSAAPDTAGTGGMAAADDKGLELIGASDCTTCHQIDRKLIGPAYVDVAKKYDDSQATVDTLVSKVIHGGSGNWGTVPMTAHANLPKEDVQTMVKYILSLDK